MPKLLSQTPIGYKVQLDNGTVYDVQKDIAHASFPELFTDPVETSPMYREPSMEEELNYSPPEPSLYDPNLSAPGQPGTQQYENQLPALEDVANDMTMPQNGSLSVPVRMNQIPFERIQTENLPTVDQMMAPQAAAALSQERAVRREADLLSQQAEIGYRPEDVAKGQSYQDVQNLRAGTETALQDQDTAVQAELMKREKEIAQARLAVPSMDPSRLWKNKGIPGQAAAMAAGFLAGFLHPDQPNEVIAQMMRMVDQDLEAQRTDIDTARYNVLGMERGYERSVGRAAMSRERLLESRAFKLESILYGIEVQKQSLQSPILQAKADAVIAGIEAELAKTYNVYTQQVVDNTSKAVAINNDAAAQAARLMLSARRGGGGKPKAAKPDKEIFTYVTDPSNPNGPLIPMYVDAALFKNMSTAEIEKRRSVVDGNDQVVRAIDKYTRTIAELGGGSIYNGIGKDLAAKAAGNGDLRARLDSAKATLVFDIKKAETLGATFSPTEQEIVSNMTGNYDTWLKEGGTEYTLPSMRNRYIEQQTDAATKLNAEIRKPIPGPVMNPETGLAQPGNIGEYRIPVTRGTFPQIQGPSPDVGGKVDPTTEQKVYQVLRAAEDAATGSQRATERLETSVDDLVTAMEKGEIVTSGLDDETLNQVDEALSNLPPEKRVNVGKLNVDAIAKDPTLVIVVDPLEKLRRARAKQYTDLLNKAGEEKAKKQELQERNERLNRKGYSGRPTR